MAASAVLDRLAVIIDSKKKLPKEADYANASWACMQADSNGYNRALSDVQEYLRLTKA